MATASLASKKKKAQKRAAARRANTLDQNLPKLDKKPEKPPVLRCPYNGTVQEVVYDDNLGRANGHYLSSGLDLTIPFLSQEDAERACPDHICRYSGDVVALVEEKGLWSFPAAYSPTRRWVSAERALYFGSRRMGKYRAPAPVVISVRPLEPEPADPFQDMRDRPDISGVVKAHLDDE